MFPAKDPSRNSHSRESKSTSKIYNLLMLFGHWWFFWKIPWLPGTLKQMPLTFCDHDALLLMVSIKSLSPQTPFTKSTLSATHLQPHLQHLIYCSCTIRLRTWSWVCYKSTFWFFTPVQAMLPRGHFCSSPAALARYLPLPVPLHGPTRTYNSDKLSNIL